MKDKQPSTRTEFLPLDDLQGDRLFKFVQQTGAEITEVRGQTVIRYGDLAQLKLGPLSEAVIGTNGKLKRIQTTFSQLILRGSDFAIIQPQLDPSEPVRIISKFGSEFRIDDIDPAEANTNVRHALNSANGQFKLATSRLNRHI